MNKELIYKDSGKKKKRPVTLRSYYGFVDPTEEEMNHPKKRKRKKKDSAILRIEENIYSNTKNLYLYPFTRDMTLELAYAKVNNDGLMIEEKTFTDNQLELAMQTNKEATRIDLIAGYIFEGGRHFYSKDEKSIIYYLADVPGYPCIELASLKLPYYADEKYPDIDLQRDFNKIGKNRTGYSLNILIKTIKDDKKRTGICIPLLLDTRYTTVSDLKNSFSYLLGNPNFRLKGHILKVDYRLGGTKVNLIDSYLTDQATEFGLKEALTQYNEEYINARRTNS